MTMLAFERMKKVFTITCLFVFVLLLGCQTPATIEEDAVTQKLKLTIIPALDWYGTYLDQLPRFLNEALIEYDPQHDSQGIVFTIDPSLRQKQLPADPNERARVIDEGMCRSATIFQVLQEICVIGNLEFNITGKTVILKPKTTKSQP
jgi:hypothetical protein